MLAPSRLAWAAVVMAAVMTPVAYSSPMLFNPSTPVGSHVKLSPSHPAFGRAIAAEDYVAPVESRATIDDLVEEVKALGGSLDPGKVSAVRQEQYPEARELETSSIDLQRLAEHFQTPIERSFSLLPKKGSTPATPWPSSYWAVYLDGINAQWNPEQPSPTVKYATAYGLNATALETTVSMVNGVLSFARADRTCGVEADCAAFQDGSACAKRRGEARGFCIPMWFGLCHAWAPAAILETEPKCPVTVGNVTFQPLDIKALLTEVYDGAGVETVFTGARFNGEDNEPDNKDQYGRYRDATRRDLGPGFFHVAIANILGLRSQSFIVDVAAGSEVWNQPVKSYEVLETKELTPNEAAVQFFRTATYPFNPVVQKIVYVKNRFKWVVESNDDGALVPTGRAEAFVQSADYEYLLELDDLGHILGGEWVNKSISEHPDFLWFPASKPPLDTISRVGISYTRVTELLTASLAAQC